MVANGSAAVKIEPSLKKSTAPKYTTVFTPTWPNKFFLEDPSTSIEQVWF